LICGVFISSTDVFIRNFNIQNNKFTISKWVHDHPNMIKKVQFAAPLVGIIAIASIPFALSALGIPAACGLAAMGTVLILSSIVTFVFLKYITCSRYDMRKHSFQEGKCPGGRLYYRGNVPILELTDDPRQTGERFGYLAGNAHGYLLGSQIYRLKKNLDLIIHTVMRQPRADKILTLLQEIRREIPENYKQEMKGLADGYNRWAYETGIETSMNENDVLLIQLIADSKHFKIKGAIQLFRKILEAMNLSPGTACTRLLQRDSQNGVKLGGNTDWCPFGDGGALSLVIVRKPQNTASFGVPAQIGIISGWNEDLAIAMNVCPGKTTRVRGKPIALFNRYLLENAHSVQDVKRLIQRVRPLGPYHLSLADAAGSAACISFYQGDKESDTIRTLEAEKPLEVLNWRYPECKGGFFNSEGRMKLLTRYFQQAMENIPRDQIDWLKVIDNGLQLTPLVNSRITLHSLLFLPESDKVFLSWDNGYAASSPKQPLSMSEVF
jgi:hypothetical protein